MKIELSGLDLKDGDVLTIKGAGQTIEVLVNDNPLPKGVRLHISEKLEETCDEKNQDHRGDK